MERTIGLFDLLMLNDCQQSTEECDANFFKDRVLLHKSFLSRRNGKFLYQKVAQYLNNSDKFFIPTKRVRYIDFLPTHD